VRILRSAQRSKEQIVAEVAQCVRSGGTVIFPTDTVYGIGCDPENDSAIDAIFALKGRSANKPLALHVTSIKQSDAFVAEWNDLARRASERFWPGPVAIVLARKPDRYERAACGLPTISLRCPDDNLCQAILAGAGPLAATSANRSGAPAFVGADTKMGDLPDADVVVLAGPTRWRTESTIVDCTHEAPVVMREGVVPASAIMTALGTLRTSG
jgi:L-threonylcarbamoyladenylate synthase